VSLSQVAIFTSFAGLPWMIKPLYGFISDSLPLFGYRRRSYLVLTGLIGGQVAALTLTTADLTMSLPITRYHAALLLLFSLSITALHPFAP
jgi:hypothetical protein